MPLPVVFVLLTVMIDTMGVGLIMPVMPDLIKEVTGGNLANAALWGGVLTAAFAAMQFLFAPFLGSLSDRFGRRPVLLLSLAVMAVDYVVMAFAGSIWLLLVGRIIGGITAATHATASATMADLSEPGKESEGFGLVAAAVGLGFIAGPLIGGALGEFGTRAPFWAAAVLAAANLILGWVVLRETVTDDIRRPFAWRRANPFGSFYDLSKLPGIGRGVISFFLYQFSFAVYPAVWAYYGKAQFGWNAGMIGLSLALFGVSMVVVQGVLIRAILARFGDRGTAILGLVFSAIGFGALAVIDSGIVALILTPLAAMGAVFSPALQGLMSVKLGPDRQGELQGILGSASAVAMAIAPLMMGGIFAHYAAPDAAWYFPGAPFILSLVLTLVAMILFLAPTSQTQKS
ncbi:TCR/Tet family MFS transporter [uncultured Pelagimonas sp.]|uniref:TCR/Tet family MFS transporter n=1 Tax=uncultured Pelagimonas sp. TaxID=1618102 RepID=UPI00260C2084|nr:TCR/Tet family MFS transporter [uncultured Pelagimonas sp.]